MLMLTLTDYGACVDHDTFLKAVCVRSVVMVKKLQTSSNLCDLYRHLLAGGENSYLASWVYDLLATHACVRLEITLADAATFWDWAYRGMETALRISPDVDRRAFLRQRARLQLARDKYWNRMTSQRQKYEAFVRTKFARSLPRDLVTRILNTRCRTETAGGPC